MLHYNGILCFRHVSPLPLIVVVRGAVHTCKWYRHVTLPIPLMLACMCRGQALADTRAVQIHAGTATVAVLRHPSNTPRFTVIVVTSDLVVAADCVCLRTSS